MELQASLGPPGFNILVLEFTKHNHTLRISLYQEEIFLQSGLDYCTVALFKLNRRNKSEIAQHSRMSKNRK